jgi:hypothetical protein
MWLRTAVLSLTVAAMTLTGAGISAAAADLGPPPQTGPVTAGPTGPGPALLTGVRVGRHDSYDRTVFDFTGGTPGYRVEYAPLYTEGKGDLVHLEGAQTLAIHFHPAHAPTVDMSQVLTPRFPTLRQVKFGGDFEGYVSAGLGLADRVGFRVFTLANPYRVVVDVAHQPTQPFGTGAVSRTGTAPDVIVERVRSGAHPGYDRLVFDIAGADPATFGVRYLSGSTIRVGFCGLGSPARSPHASHSGPATVPIGLTAIRSVSFTVVGAGVMTADVSTAARHGFRILTLSNPTRVVLDVAL